MVIDFSKGILTGAIVVDALPIGSAPATQPTGRSIVLHPNAERPASLKLELLGVKKPVILNVTLKNPNSKAFPILFGVKVTDVDGALIYSAKLELIGGTAAQLRSGSLSTEEDLRVELSTQMATAGMPIDLAWARIEDLFIGPPEEAERLLPEAVQESPPKQSSSREGSWYKDFIGSSQSRLVLPAEEYTLVPRVSPNSADLNELSSVLLQNYESNPVRQTEALELFAADSLTHVYRGMLASGTALVGKTAAHAPTPSLLLAQKIWADASGTPIVELDEALPVFIMSHYGHRNYGHWLIEMFPRLEIVAPFVRAGRVKIGLTKEQVSVPIIMDTLNIAKIDRSMLAILPTEPCKIRRVLYTSPISHHMHPGWISPSVPGTLDKLVGYHQASCRGRRIFVSRMDGLSRHLVNEDDVYNELEPLGFERVLTGAMSFTEQVDTFRSAAEVVGVFGASMTNTVFMPSDGSVCLLSPNNFMDHFYWNIASIRRLRYAEFLGKVQSEREAEVNAIHDFKLNVKDFVNFYMKWRKG